MKKERSKPISVFEPDEIWPPSVGTFPTCRNCIYSYEDSEQCRRFRTDKNECDENGEECAFGNWRRVNGGIGDHCGDGIFAAGEMGKRKLVTFLDWYKAEIDKENEKWRANSK